MASPKSSPGQLVAVPPSNIGEQLLRLLDSKEGADVTFQVGSREFAAHTLVLAARSPVFHATFFEQQQTNGSPARGAVRVDGVGEAAFEALLHFAYADELPPATAELLAAGSAATGTRMEAAGDLIAAADTYGMERMRLLCERALCEAVADAYTAAATLVLAVRLRCTQLKAFCVEYIAKPGVLKAMIGSDAYVSLKEFCPDVLVEIMEKVVAVLVVQGNGNGSPSPPSLSQRLNDDGTTNLRTRHQLFEFVHPIEEPTLAIHPVGISWLPPY